MLTKYSFYCTIILSFLLSSKLPSSGQCLDGLSFDRQLHKILKTEDNKKIISKLIPLIGRARKCQLGDSTMAQMLHVLGRTLWYNHQLDSAIVLTQQAIALNASRKITVQPANLCHSYYNLASIYFEKGNLDASLLEIERAINYGKRYVAKTGSVANSYCLMASIQTAVGDYEKAVSTAEMAYYFATLANRQDLQAKSLIEKAQGLLELGKLLMAETALNDAVDICNEIGISEPLGSIYSLFADLKKLQNIPKEVVKFYLLAFDHYKRIHYDYGCGQAAANLGHYYADNLSLPKEALRFYKIAQLYVHNNFVKALLYHHTATIYRKQKKYQEAILLEQQALVTAEFKIDADNIYQNPSAASLKSMVDKTILLLIIQGKATIWLESAKAHGNQQRELTTALQTYALADTLVDQMRWEHTGRASKLFWREKTRDLYEHAIETCFLLKSPEKALYFFEKSRAVMLTDQLNESGAAGKLSQADQQNEKRLKTQIQALQSKLSDATTHTKATIQKELLVTQEHLDQFIKSLEKSNPQYYAYKFDNRVPTLADIRAKVLAHNQTFVSYFSGQQAIYGLAIDQKNIRFKKLDHMSFSETFPMFQFLLSNRELQNQKFSDYLVHANRIFEILFKPFDIKKGARVIISPDGNFIPFEALTVSPTSPKYLVYEYSFSYAYSASYLTKVHRTQTGLPNLKDFLGLAPVHFPPKVGQPELPGSDAALERIAAPFTFSKLLTKRQATRNAYEQSARDYRIVQLLTHAEADSTQVIPRIYFADSTLTLNELPERSQSQTQLLILSACRTGIGKNQQGEGVFSLARGFAGMGIPSVLTTLWNVENESTYNLTEQFVQHLCGDDPLDVALQKAKLNQLSNGVKSAQLPYAWAGMVLIGNAEPLLITSAWLWGIIGLLLISVILAFMWRRSLHP